MTRIAFFQRKGAADRRAVGPLAVSGADTLDEHGRFTAGSPVAKRLSISIWVMTFLTLPYPN